MLSQEIWAIKAKYLMFLLPAYVLYAGIGLRWVRAKLPDAALDRCRAAGAVDQAAATGRVEPLLQVGFGVEDAAIGTLNSRS